MKKILAADLYCGAGGSTAGMARACKRLGYTLDALAINHWSVAISTHQANQPWARHICWPVDQVDPRRVVPDGRLDLLWASPECTHHSIARGGVPVSDQKRAGAWHVPAWLTALRVDSLIVENVREFQNWGPLIEKRDHRGKVLYDKKTGRPQLVPDPTRKGETFRAWVQALESLGYRVEHRVLNCADYGAPTSRQRLFVMAKRGKGRIEWPRATHGTAAGLLPYRTAREVIDWSIKGESIFTRKRPLTENTLRRIAAGLRKFGGAAADGLVQPFLTTLTHVGPPRVHSIDAPLPTITTAHRGEIAVVEPFLVAYHSGHGDKRDGDRRTHSLAAPLPTLDCSNRYGLCEPFLIKYYGTGGARAVNEPLDTVTCKDRFGLCEPACLDILFRMLYPHELAAAQGFDKGYQFSGSKGDQVRQIGNAVPPDMADALTTAQVA